MVVFSYYSPYVQDSRYGDRDSFLLGWEGGPIEQCLVLARRLSNIWEMTTVKQLVYFIGAIALTQGC